MLMYRVLKGVFVKTYRNISNCVACSSSDLRVILDLGKQGLANEYQDQKVQIDEFPLVLNACEVCTHCQLSIEVNPDRLFRDYAYVSSTSKTMKNYFEILRNRIVTEQGPTGRLLDIGSNDGTFLESFKESDWNVIGVDPALNLLHESLSRGVITIPTFFNSNIANLFENVFDCIVAMNVFAHTANPIDILDGIAKCLKPDGVAYIQTSQANMLLTGEFDTIYHEHISFFTVKSMRALLGRSGLFLKDVEIVDIHGDSYLLKISNQPTLNISQREEFEIVHFSNFPALTRNFSEMAKGISKMVSELVQNYREQGFKIVSYGAAAKGNTFLNYSNIQLDFIFDDTPHKIGKYAPAGNAIVSDPLLLGNISGNILVIIPAWNFKDEITSKIQNLREKANDKILVYFPTMSVQSLRA